MSWASLLLASSGQNRSTIRACSATATHRSACTSSMTAYRACATTELAQELALVVRVDQDLDEAAGRPHQVRTKWASSGP